MRKLLVILSMLALLSQTAMAAEVFGKWATQKKQAEITIRPCGAEICGVISQETIPGGVDDKNKDLKLRGRPMVGVQLFRLKETIKAEKWEGELYNPQDGNMYKGQLIMLNDSHVKLEGCILIFCLGETWSRI